MPLSKEEGMKRIAEILYVAIFMDEQEMFDWVSSQSNLIKL